MRRRILLLVPTLALTAALVVGCFRPGSSKAISGNEWQAGRIIGDGLFANKDGLTVEQIQGFLNAKVPSCDTNGSLPSSYGSSQTRAQWAAANGKPLPPYTCLRDYYEVPKTDPSPGIPANNYGGQPIPAGAKSSAQLIWDASQRYSINPKVLLTTIQKESAGPLTVDDWPWQSQYTYAMGAHCPDSGPGGSANCDSNYAGFSIQIMESARLFRYYLDNMSQPWWPYKKVGNYDVLYNPNRDCGSSTVNIQTMATAALYTYTPYQPNQAAINNLYGLGDNCSAYGNRNFWRIYNDWFGSSLVEVPYGWAFEGITAYVDSDRKVKMTDGIAVAPGGSVYITLKARNIGSITWDPSFMRLGTWAPTDRQSAFYDSSWPVSARPTALKEVSVVPGQTGTFEFTLKAPQAAGSYREYFNLVAEARTWLNDVSLHFDIDVVPPVAPSNSKNVNLPSGQTLKPGQYLLSPDRHNVLTLQKDGNLVYYSDFKPVWYTGTAGYPAGQLVMQGDGNLVLYDKNGKALWNTETAGNPGASLTTQTDGNLVLYSAASTALWANYTIHRPDNLSRVSYAMSSAILYQGQQLETADRKYRLALQEDGNLVLYSDKRALWATYNSMGKPSPYLVMQSDGNLVLYDANGTPLWYSGTSGQGPSRLLMQADGNLVVYNSSNRATWNTATQGQQ